MKKFHKRAAVFLTAATLAGLPAGAFFYSSPGSLTVWADNVEVESSEESSPEDVDFSDGSEVEIHADPVEQAQEDAGNDVTETPEVGITFTEPEGWQTDTATVKIQVEDTKNTGAFSIAKVEARLSENGGWSDITGNMEVSISLLMREKMLQKYPLSSLMKTSQLLLKSQNQILQLGKNYQVQN